MSRTRTHRTRWWPETRWRHATSPGSIDSIQPATYLRLVGTEVHGDSHERLGIFQLAARVKHRRGLSGSLLGDLRDHLSWFGTNLALPRRFSHRRDGFRRSATGVWVRQPIAISWFKPEAEEHIARARSLADLVREAGIPIEEITTRLPGYITYADRHQVVAVPFASA